MLLLIRVYLIGAAAGGESVELALRGWRIECAQTLAGICGTPHIFRLGGRWRAVALGLNEPTREQWDTAMAAIDWCVERNGTNG